MKNLSDSMLPALTQAVRTSDRYRELIARSLPAELATQILFVRAGQGTIRITVSSAAFATRLRFFEATILEQVSALTVAQRVSVHVLPNGSMPTLSRSSDRLSPRATDTTINAIAQTARAVGDRKLQESLERLARNLDAGCDSDNRSDN